MSNQTKVTFKGVDCYGKLVKGESVEVICNWGSDLVDNKHYSDWESLVTYLISEISGIRELVAC
jgi:hypothetical protein